MTFTKLSWMPDALLGAGLKVAECDGWRERGRAEMGTVRGVMCHHTANPKPGNMPTLEILTTGRADLRGPLCNLGLGRDGTFYIVAAGRANHAGIGEWAGLKNKGNSCFIGIEAENAGDGSEPWPPEQVEAYQRGVYALLKHLNVGADMCVGHKEYALPQGRKIDPNFSMKDFRGLVSDYLVGRTPPAPIRPRSDTGRPTLRRGMDDAAVELLQQAIGVRADGVFGPKTEAALRDWQRAHDLLADGICGPKTWALLLDNEGQPAFPPDAPEPPPPAPVQADEAAPPPAPHDDASKKALGDGGVRLIKQFEGCEKKRSNGDFEAYPDPGSKTGRPWTIGWGSTGADILPGTVWTQQQCDDRFVVDMQRYVRDVNRALGSKVAETSQNQFDALVSFHYNTGAIFKATLTKLHLKGDFAGAAKEFGKWVKNDGKILRGLVRRREAERVLYETG